MRKPSTQTWYNDNPKFFLESRHRETSVKHRDEGRRRRKIEKLLDKRRQRDELKEVWE